MVNAEPIKVDTDVLILGGGMAGCGAAYEAAYWAQTKGLRVTLVEKSVIERSGAAAAGLSAINCYMGTKWGENQPEDFVRYVRRDLMGLCREDLVYDIARNVDSSVHMFESWGLPFFKTPEGRYRREGRWQVMIHGESYKPIVAEAARKALGTENIYERVFISHLLHDSFDSGRIAGAAGFGVRDGRFYVFRARAVICAAGGATGVFRPHAVGEGLGRIWYAPWNTGSTYKLMIRAGAKMCQFEHRLVAPRFKDGYGAVGMWFLLFKAVVKNAYGEEVEKKWTELLKAFAPYGTGDPIPTPLRTYQLLLDIRDGKGPHYIRTDEGLQQLFEAAREDATAKAQTESDAWEDFLDMTPSQALLWAARDLNPAASPSEIVLTEPYLVGSHAGASGAWVSGPEDIAPPEYFWGYNRMTSIVGLFAAGDSVGASSHKFSSGSYTEGRLAAKAAVKFVSETGAAPACDLAAIAAAQSEVLRPLAVFARHHGATTNEEISPDYLLPKSALQRLQRIMDEYCAGVSAGYATNAPTLERCICLLDALGKDLAQLGARNYHELLRAAEVVDRYWCAQAHARHLLYREESRWPGYYLRSDFPALDDHRWKCFVTSRHDPVTAAWTLTTQPCLQILT